MHEFLAAALSVTAAIAGAPSRRAHPDDPLGAAAEAATYLFEEFNHAGVLTSEFFLDDKRFLGGVEGQPDPRRRAAFLSANKSARKMAQERMKADPDDPDALFVLTLADGMQGDFEALIEKRLLRSWRVARKAVKMIPGIDTGASGIFRRA